jgi:hypothetical protein
MEATAVSHQTITVTWRSAWRLGLTVRIRLIFRLVERHARLTTPAHTMVVEFHLLLVPPLLGGLQGVTE